MSRKRKKREEREGLGIGQGGTSGQKREERKDRQKRDRWKKRGGGGKLIVMNERITFIYRQICTYGEPINLEGDRPNRREKKRKEKER